MSGDAEERGSNQEDCSLSTASDGADCRLCRVEIDSSQQSGITGRPCLVIICTTTPS